MRCGSEMRAIKAYSFTSGRNSEGEVYICKKDTDDAGE